MGVWGRGLPDDMTAFLRRRVMMLFRFKSYKFISIYIIILDFTMVESPGGMPLRKQEKGRRRTSRSRSRRAGKI